MSDLLHGAVRNSMIVRLRVLREKIPRYHFCGRKWH